MQIYPLSKYVQVRKEKWTICCISLWMIFPHHCIRLCFPCKCFGMKFPRQDVGTKFLWPPVGIVSIRGKCGALVYLGMWCLPWKCLNCKGSPKTQSCFGSLTFPSPHPLPLVTRVKYLHKTQWFFHFFIQYYI